VACNLHSVTGWTYLTQSMCGSTTTELKATKRRRRHVLSTRRRRQRSWARRRGMRPAERDWLDASDTERVWLLMSPLNTKKSVKETFGYKLRTMDAAYKIMQEQCASQHWPLPTKEAYAVWLKYMHLYPAFKDARQTLSIHGYVDGVSDRYMVTQVLPAGYALALALKKDGTMLNWGDRLAGEYGAWNHGAHFDECFTHIWDGFPLPVQKPGTWYGDAEFLYQGKYKACVYKGHLAISFWGGIVACSGPHPGTKNDNVIWEEECLGPNAIYPSLPGEWGLGDMAYISCLRILTSRRHPKPGSSERAWDKFDEFGRHLIAHYRSRVEIVIKKLKSHGWCQAIFRGSEDVLKRMFIATSHLTALEIKQDFDIDKKMMFECVGPWPHRFY